LCFLCGQISYFHKDEFFYRRAAEVFLDDALENLISDVARAWLEAAQNARGKC
jgi:hypothetical protein